LDHPSSGYYHPQPGTPQLQISDQTAEQNGAAVGTGNAVCKTLTKPTETVRFFNYKGSNGFAGFVGF